MDILSFDIEDFSKKTLWVGKVLSDNSIIELKLEFILNLAINAAKKIKIVFRN